jgi:hypothetical protein
MEGVLSSISSSSFLNATTPLTIHS